MAVVQLSVCFKAQRAHTIVPLSVTSFSWACAPRTKAPKTASANNIDHAHLIMEPPNGFWEGPSGHTVRRPSPRVVVSTVTTYRSRPRFASKEEISRPRERADNVDDHSESRR